MGKGFKNQRPPVNRRRDMFAVRWTLSLLLRTGHSFLEARCQLVERHSECGAPCSHFNKVEPALPTLAFTHEWLVDVKPRGQFALQEAGGLSCLPKGGQKETVLLCVYRLFHGWTKLERGEQLAVQNRICQNSICDVRIRLFSWEQCYQRHLSRKTVYLPVILGRCWRAVSYELAQMSMLLDRCLRLPK